MVIEQGKGKLKPAQKWTLCCILQVADELDNCNIFKSEFCFTSSIFFGIIFDFVWAFLFIYLFIFLLKKSADFEMFA